MTLKPINTLFSQLASNFSFILLLTQFFEFNSIIIFFYLFLAELWQATLFSIRNTLMLKYCSEVKTLKQNFVWVKTASVTRKQIKTIFFSPEICRQKLLIKKQSRSEFIDNATSTTKLIVKNRLRKQAKMIGILTFCWTKIAAWPFEKNTFSSPRSVTWCKMLTKNKVSFLDGRQYERLN